MKNSWKILAVVMIAGMGLTSTGLVVAPFSGSARAAAGDGQADLIADRIGGAMALVDAVEPDPALLRAAEAVAKQDLGFRPGCAGAAWPNIAPECLATSDGSPARDVRFVTIGYQSGEATSVLMRIPAREVAAR